MRWPRFSHWAWHRKVQDTSSQFGRRWWSFFWDVFFWENLLPLPRPNPFGEKKDMVRWTEECDGNSLVFWYLNSNFKMDGLIGAEKFGNIFFFRTDFIGNKEYVFSSSGFPSPAIFLSRKRHREPSWPTPCNISFPCAQKWLEFREGCRLQLAPFLLRISSHRMQHVSCQKPLLMLGAKLRWFLDGHHLP